MATTQSKRHAKTQSSFVSTLTSKGTLMLLVVVLSSDLIGSDLILSAPCQRQFQRILELKKTQRSNTRTAQFNLQYYIQHPKTNISITFPLHCLFFLVFGQFFFVEMSLFVISSRFFENKHLNNSKGRQNSILQQFQKKHTTRQHTLTTKLHPY